MADNEYGQAGDIVFRQEDLQISRQFPPLTADQLHRKHRDRLEVCRQLRWFRARKRLEQYIRYVHGQQYEAVRAGLPLGDRPYIWARDHDTIAAPYTDLFTIVPERELIEPVDDCAICRMPLNDPDMGAAHALPCAHIFHYSCIEEAWHQNLNNSQIPRDRVNQCPSCRTNYTNICTPRDYYHDWYQKDEQESTSAIESFEISDSDDDGNRCYGIWATSSPTAAGGSDGLPLLSRKQAHEKDSIAHPPNQP